jgi:hypothetical protein
MARTTQNSRRAGLLTTLSNARHSPVAAVRNFPGFSLRRSASAQLSTLESEDPTTPTRPFRSGTPSDDGGPPDDGDDGEPPSEPEDLPDDPNARVMAQLSRAIDKLARSGRSRDTSDSSNKVRKPDPFDGSSPRKLRAFLVQCALNFQSRPKTFSNDRAKVTFAQSYLSGMALEWFEPDLLDSATPDDPPLWMDNYLEFVAELQENFGPHDPTGDAERQIEELDMKENQRINKYVVEFNRLATQLSGWGDSALRRQYYNGLPSRIKDEVCRVGKPSSLPELKLLSQTIDARYWERKAESARETKTTSSASSAAPKPKPAASTSPTANTTTSARKPTKPAPSSNAPDLTGKLGKDGKLTAEERKRRFDMKLCLFCAGDGHEAKDCPKSSSRAAKARVATITVPPEVSPEPKK